MQNYLLACGEMSNFAVNMIEVAQIIERLLLQNDCVIVPGLGGFVAQDCEAFYVKEENIFLPPYRSVSFNPRLAMNDGLFVTEYAMLNGLNYAEAKSAVIKEVGEIRHQISKYGKFSFPGVGSLTVSDSGNYEFIPLICGIDSPEHFGLDSLFVQTIKDQTKTVPVVEVNTKEEETVTVNIRKNVVRYVATIAAAVAIFFICLLPFTGLKKNIAEANMFEMVWAFVTNGSTTAPSCTNELDIPSAHPATKASTTAAKESANKPEADKQNKKSSAAKAKKEAAENAHKPYGIILASAIPYEGAERMVRELRRAGLKEARIVDDRNMLRVVYGHYANSAEAAQALREGRALNPAFDHAWILAIEQ